MTEQSAEEEMQFDWIKLQNEVHFVQETQKEKLIRKVSENPLIPIGEIINTVWITVKNRF